MPIVAMPDGTQVNFPDDMPSEQIKGLIANKFPDISKQAEQGFMGNVVDSMSKRLDKAANIINATSNREQTALEAIPQFAGQVVGAAGDVIGQGVVSAAKTGYEALPQSFQDRQKLGLEALANTDAGKKAAEIVKSYDENLNTYNQQNPRAGRNFEAIRNLSALVPIPGVGGSAAKIALDTAAGVGDVAKLGGRAAYEVGKSARKGVAEVARDALNIEKAAPLPTYEGAKVISQASYKKADELGGIFKPEIRDEFINTIKEHLPGTEKLIQGKTTVENILEGAMTNKGKPLTLDGLQQIDKELTDLKYAEVHPNGKPTEEGMRIGKIQNKLRDLATNASEDSVVGGKAGYDALQNGIKNWATASRLYDIEKIFTRASMMDNEATSIKAGFRNLYLNDKKLAGYTAREKDLIKAAGKSTIAANTLRTVFGSRLIGSMIGTVGGGIGGGIPGAMGGAAAGAAISAASRAGAAGLAKRQGNKVLRELGKRNQ